MKRVVGILALLVLIAATPQEALPGLEANGYYVEEGASAREEVVSEAVSDGRADGGRLYIVVLAEEPPGGATTFSDSTLDLLGNDAYVVTVAPETVGFAENGDVWTTEQMNQAIDASLDGGSDDEVVQLFVDALVEGAGGGISFVWILLLGAVAIGVWIFFSRRNRAKQSAARLEKVKALAQEKLDEVANDILEMEDEVSVSDSAEVKDHYQRASKMYAQAMEDNRRAESAAEMLEVSEELDLAIWELDCAEALLDGKPKPPKPERPQPTAPPPPPPVPEGRGTESPPPRVPGTIDQFDRRPQRHSTGSNEMTMMLMTMMAMGGMRGGRRGGGFGGGFGGFGGGSSMGGGRSRGGGRRG